MHLCILYFDGKVMHILRQKFSTIRYGRTFLWTVVDHPIIVPSKYAQLRTQNYQCSATIKEALQKIV